MKKLIYFALILLIASCSSDKLDREKAFQIIKKSGMYPKASSYRIFTADPTFARRMLAAGLESSGMLRVKRTQTLSEEGQPIITFTEKAQPYLLETPEKYKDDNVRVVKLADEDLEEVTGIQMVNNNQAVVEYTTSYKNISPFKVLSEDDLEGKKTYKANFSLYDDGWRMEKN